MHGILNVFGQAVETQAVEYKVGKFLGETAPMRDYKGPWAIISDAPAKEGNVKENRRRPEIAEVNRKKRTQLYKVRLVQLQINRLL